MRGDAGRGGKEKVLQKFVETGDTKLVGTPSGRSHPEYLQSLHASGQSSISSAGVRMVDGRGFATGAACWNACTEKRER